MGEAGKSWLRKQRGLCHHNDKHLCLDTLRAPQIETDNDSVLVQKTEPTPQPDTAYEIKEDMKVLLNIINKLPEQQRKILLLRHFEDKSTDEIETETGLSNAKYTGTSLPSQKND